MYLSNEIKSAPMLCADFRQKNYKCWWRTTCTAHGQGKVAMEMVHMDMDMSRAHGLVATEARVVHGFNCIPGFLRPNVGFPIHLREHESSEEINQTQPLTTYKAPSFACGCSACHRVQDILRRVQAHEQREYCLETCNENWWTGLRYSHIGM